MDDASEITVVDWTELETEHNQIKQHSKLSSSTSIIENFLKEGKEGEAEEEEVNRGSSIGDQSRIFSSERSDDDDADTTRSNSIDGGDSEFESECKKRTLENLKQTFVLSDAAAEDFPVVYASSGFYELTGYSPEEIIGKNCRILQGPGTDRKEIEKIREALASGKSYCGRILNYKKDGTPLWNLLTLTPIKDASGKAVKYIGMLVDVSKNTEGVHEKDERPNGLSSSLIHYDARHRDKAMESFAEVVRTVKHFKSHGPVQSVDGTGKHEKLPCCREGSVVRTQSLPDPETFNACDRICSNSMAL